MKCSKQVSGSSLRIAACAICNRISTCPIFKEWYHKDGNKTKYNRFLSNQVIKFPEKYSLKGDIIMAKTTNPGYVIVLDKDVVVQTIPISKLKTLDGEALSKLKGKKLIEAKASEIELVYSISIKKKEWDGKFKKTVKGR